MELVGFNNLKKALSFSFYDFVIALTPQEQRSYVRYINEHYNATRISKLLEQIVHIIEAQVLGISKQDYEPYGASSMLLLGDIKGSGVDFHLDKSHITALYLPRFRQQKRYIEFSCRYRPLNLWRDHSTPIAQCNF